MAGSYQNPVQLDHYQDIVEVGWPNNRIEWLAFDITFALTTGLSTPVECTSGEALPAGATGGAEFVSRSYINSHTWDQDGFTMYAWKTDEEEVYADTPPDPSVASFGDTYSPEQIVGKKGARAESNGTASPDAPEFIKSYFEFWLGLADVEFNTGSTHEVLWNNVEVYDSGCLFWLGLVPSYWVSYWSYPVAGVPANTPVVDGSATLSVPSTVEVNATFSTSEGDVVVNGVIFSAVGVHVYPIGINSFGAIALYRRGS